jgi:hypothetical protein
MTKSLTLEEWETIIQSAIRAGEEKAELATAGMEARPDFATNTNAHRTPRPEGKAVSGRSVGCPRDVTLQMAVN